MQKLVKFKLDFCSNICQQYLYQFYLNQVAEKNIPSFDQKEFCLLLYLVSVLSCNIFY